MQVMPVVEVFVSSLQDMPPFLGLFRLKMNVNYGRVPKRLAFLEICALRLEKGIRTLKLGYSVAVMSEV